MAVRDFADWATIITTSPEGELGVVALEHRDPARAVPLAAFHHLLGQPGGVPFRARSVIETGHSELLTELNADVFEPGAVQAELAQLVRTMGAESAIVVPLTSSSRTLGAMIFVSAGRRHRFRPQRRRRWPRNWRDGWR